MLKRIFNYLYATQKQVLILILAMVFIALGSIMYFSYMTTSEAAKVTSIETEAVPLTQDQKITMLLAANTELMAETRALAESYKRLSDDYKELNKNYQKLHSDYEDLNGNYEIAMMDNAQLSNQNADLADKFTDLIVKQEQQNEQLLQSIFN